MTFTTAEIVVIIAALSSAAVSIINALKRTQKTEEIKANTDALLVKADEIHEQTNSNLKEVKDQLNNARDQINELKDTVTNLKVQQEKLQLVKK